MSKFAVFDIDGTLIRWQLYHALANEFAKSGLLGKDGLRTVKDARKKWKNREAEDSFKDYERALVKIFDGAISKIQPDIFDQTVEKVVSEYKLQSYKYTRELVKSLKDQGYFLLAISGSPKEVVAPIAEHYGFDDYQGSTYERTNNGFTGNKEIVAHDKKTALENLVAKNKLNFKGSVAVGDTESDIPMLEMVEQPIAFNPNKEFLNHAEKSGWKIVVERKNVIYQLEKKGEQYILA